MKTPPPPAWPPLITNAKLSRLVRARDWLLTVLAWLGLVFAARLGLLLIWDYFSEPIFRVTRMPAPDWDFVWQRFAPFAYMILFVVGWIVAWGLARRPQLRRNLDPRRLTPPLPLQEHAASLGLDPHAIEQWRQWRIVTVHFDGHRIAGAQEGGRGSRQ